MSNLQDLINKLKVESVNLCSYVYYEKDTGKIHKVSSRNTPDENYTIFEVSSEEVQPILSGERRTEEFIIFYDVSTKQVRLKEVAYDDSHNTAATMNYQLPVIKNSHDGHHSLTEVYEGVDVYLWDITHEYSKGELVWVDNIVYKVEQDIISGEQFNKTLHKVFVEDVELTSVPTQTHSTKKLEMQPEYQGVHVDVWYKELLHLAGQHVWLNGTVYRLVNDQDADTEFTMDNAEIIVSNVKLYADENQSLATTEDVSLGDIILKYNNLYGIYFSEQEFNKDKTSIFFYNSNTTMLYYNNKNCLEITLDELDETVISNNIKLNLTNINDLKNGQTILCGKKLYQLQLDKAYDIIIQQNTVNKSWSMMLNPYTKKFLMTSGYNSKETLYFSVTAKYDPNVLYRSLEFTVGDLLAEATSIIPFKFEQELDPNDVSIYTARYFDSYAHEVI